MAIIRVEERLLVGPIDPDWECHRDGTTLVIEVESGLSISNAVKAGRLQFTQPLTALINGVTSDLDRELQAGDDVRLLPQIAGGKS